MKNVRPEEVVRERLGRYLFQMKFWFALFSIICILSGIWHAIVSSQLNTDFFKKIAGDSPFNITVSLSVLSCGSLVVFIVLLFTLYECGNLYIAHFLLALTVLLSILGYFGLTLLNIYNTKPGTRKIYEETMKKMIDLPENERENITNEWMNEYQCTNVTSCEDSIESYILLRCDGEFFACCFIMAISFISIIGLIIAVLCMGFMKRPIQENAHVDLLPLADAYDPISDQ